MPASFRADHVGSFLRPQELKDARAAYDAGTLALDALRELEDREISRVLAMQRAAGIEIYSDGEYRRGGWSADFAEAVAGYVPGSPPVVLSWHMPPLGMWHTGGGYERIAEQVFGGIDVDRFLLEYDSERAGGFEPLRFMPGGKTVVLGLITTKSGELESQDALLRRIDEAATYVPMKNLALSPQCGFASTLVGNPLTWDEQRRKLELVVETARKAWA